MPPEMRTSMALITRRFSNKWPDLELTTGSSGTLPETGGGGGVAGHKRHQRAAISNQICCRKGCC